MLTSYLSPIILTLMSHCGLLRVPVRIDDLPDISIQAGGEMQERVGMVRELEVT